MPSAQQLHLLVLDGRPDVGIKEVAVRRQDGTRIRSAPHLRAAADGNVHHRAVAAHVWVHAPYGLAVQLRHAVLHGTGALVHGLLYVADFGGILPELLTDAGGLLLVTDDARPHILLDLLDSSLLHGNDGLRILGIELN